MDEQAFDRWFRKFNSWGLSIADFLRLQFIHGDLERPDLKRSRGDPTEPGDVVYFHPEHGTAMTRHMAYEWWSKGGDYKTGWEAALQHSQRR